MKNISILSKQVKQIIVFSIIMLFSSISIYSQGLQVDLSFGFYNSDPKFHHDYTVTSKSTDSKTINSHSYTIGLTKEIKNNFYLRTEIGIVSTNLSMSLSYNYDEGLGNESYNLITPLFNKKLYLGIIPEYRIKYNTIDFFINVGVLIYSDVNNEFTTDYYIVGSNSKPLPGITLNAGMKKDFGRLGIKFGIEYISFSKSQLINFYHPYISYTNIGGKLGIVYSVGK